MSQKKRGGLGRGLSALIPQGQQEDVPKAPSSPLDVFFAGNVSRETISDSRAEGVSQGRSTAQGRPVAESRPEVEEMPVAPTKAQNSDKTEGKSGSDAKAKIPGKLKEPGKSAANGKTSRPQSSAGRPSTEVKAGTDSADNTTNRPASGVPVDSRQSINEPGSKKDKRDTSSLSNAARALLSAPPRNRKKGKQGGRSRSEQKTTRTNSETNIENVSRETISTTDTPQPVTMENDNGQYGPVLYRMVDETTSDSAVVPEYTEDLSPVPGATFGEVPVWSIVANREQPRTEFAENELQELVQSVSEVGVLQPIVVRPLAPEDQEKLYQERLDRARKRELFRYHNAESLVAEQDEVARHNGDLEQLLSVSDVKQIGLPRYELIMGERRLRASRIAGLETIPTIVRRTEDQDVLRDALLENLHRVQLNPIEEAAAYQQLMDDFACTQEVLAKKVARSRPQIANMLRLLKLPAEVQKRVAAGTLSMGHARAILGLKGSEAQIHLATRVIREGLSVRATELISSQGNPYAAASGKKRPRAQTNDLPESLRSSVTTLGDTLDTCVKVQLGKKKCKIVIDAADRDDLERLMRLLNR